MTTTTTATATGPAPAANPQINQPTNQTASAPKGRFFANQTFHFETLRGAGYIPSGGADIGEVLATVSQIADDDQQGWFAAWSATSDRVFELAERTKDPISKGNAYLRAHGYQRTGGFLLPPDDPKRPASWEKEIGYFYKGLEALGVPYERITVPYEGSSLRALYIPGPHGAEKKPLIVLTGGFDSSLEELYLVIGRAAGDRGYSVLIYEGPGQGQALRNGLTFTPQWERPTSAVLNEFQRTHEEPVKMVIMGMSMGGYFAPRAAAFDERFDGVIAFDACFDVAETTRPAMSALKANPMAMKNPDVAWAYKNAVWTMGTKDLEDTVKAFAPYTLRDVAQRIRQDVLILQGTEDHFIPFHQAANFETALVNARSVTTRVFDHASGGAQHCQGGAVTLVYAAVFDWLLEKFGPESMK
jgi:pimeloyl-ACP methyl ester carboxylesterase